MIKKGVWGDKLVDGRVYGVKHIVWGREAGLNSGLRELGIFPILFDCTLDMSMNVLLLAAPAAGGAGAGQPRVKPRVTLRDPQHSSSSHPDSPTDTAVQHTTGEGNHCMSPSYLQYLLSHLSNLSLDILAISKCMQK